MIHPALPIGIIQPLTDRIKKFLFLKTFTISHNEYLKRRMADKKLYPLGNFFEFKLFLENEYFSNLNNPMSYLTLKNISDRSFSRIELSVEASSRDLDVKFSDFTALFNVGRTSYMIILPKIPLKSFDFTEENRLIRIYDTIRIKIFIYDNSVSENNAIAESLPINIIYNEFLNSRWDKKWGLIWNLDYIESCKHNIKQKLEYYLISRNKFPILSEPTNLFFQYYKFLRLLIGHPLFKILSKQHVISALFWLPIFLRLKKLKGRESGESA